MGFGLIIIKLFLVYYTFYFISFFNIKSRKDIQHKNKKLNKLRTIGIKTLEEQKKFLDLRYPKRGKKKKFKFKWIMIPRLLFGAAKFIGIYMLYGYLLSFLPFEIKVWHAILIVMLFPIIINMILKKFSLQKNDISVFFK